MRAPIWETEGDVNRNVTTAADALASAGLAWQVKMLPLQVVAPNGRDVVTDPVRRAIVRADNHAILGVGRSRYLPHSNVESLSFLDELVAREELSHESAWAWRGGECVGLTYALNDEGAIYVLARTSHDGGGAVIVAPFVVSEGCVVSNVGLNPRQFRATHARAGNHDADNALAVAVSYSEVWLQAVESFVSRPASKTLVTNVASRVFNKHAQEAVDHWLSTPTVDGFGGTRYGAFIALAEFCQWTRPRNAHLESIIRGPIARTTAKIFASLI